MIVFGTIRVLREKTEKRTAIERLALKYAPEDTAENRWKTIEREWNILCMLEMTPEHISGKESRKLAQNRLAEKQEKT